MANGATVATRAVDPPPQRIGMTDAASRSGSAVNPDYWWYVARAELLEATFGTLIAAGSVVVDIGSADGPSVGWLDDRAHRVPLDIDAAGLPPGGVCASALALPFADASLDVVSAFDVVEHFRDEAALLAELHRVLRPGGRLLVSVPAYDWAWSSHDVAARHHRRYTRRRVVTALTAAGFTTERTTYAFGSTLPLFAADRLRERVLGVAAQRVTDTPLPPMVERLLLTLARADRWLLRRTNVPFGSSVFAAAVRT